MPGSTPIYGFPYPDPSDLVANYPALGQQLAEDIEDVLPTVGSLVPVAPTSIANTGGTATATRNVVTFSGCTVVTINGIFDSTYDNYRLIVKQAAPASANTVMALRLRTGSDETGSLYSSGFSYVARTTAATSTSSNNGSQSFRLNGAYNADVYVAVEIGGPNLAAKTGYAVHGTFANNSDIFSYTGGGLLFSDTQYTGITIILESGLAFSGNVAIYGYRD